MGRGSGLIRIDCEGDKEPRHSPTTSHSCWEEKEEVVPVASLDGSIRSAGPQTAPSLSLPSPTFGPSFFLYEKIGVEEERQLPLFFPGSRVEGWAE
jgi:hypothetical protein